MNILLSYFSRAKSWLDAQGHNLYILAGLVIFVIASHGKPLSGGWEILYFLGPFLYSFWWYTRTGNTKIVDTSPIIRSLLLLLLSAYIYLVWHGKGNLLLGSRFNLIADGVWLPLSIFLSSFFICEVLYSFFRKNLKDDFWGRFIRFIVGFCAIGALWFLLMILSAHG